MSPVLLSLGNVHFMCPFYNIIHTAHVNVFHECVGVLLGRLSFGILLLSFLLIKMSYYTGLWYIYSNADQKLNYAYAFLMYIKWCILFYAILYFYLEVYRVWSFTFILSFFLPSLIPRIMSMKRFINKQLIVFPYFLLSHSTAQCITRLYYGLFCKFIHTIKST